MRITHGPMGAMKVIRQDVLSKMPRLQLPSALRGLPGFLSKAPGLTSVDLESDQQILMDIIFD